MMTGRKKAKNQVINNDQQVIDDQPKKIVLPVTIDGNPQRKQLMLTASQTNKDVIWLGGIENEGVPLEPGEKIKLNTNQSLEVIGQIGDWLYIAELVREAL